MSVGAAAVAGERTWEKIGRVRVGGHQLRNYRPLRDFRFGYRFWRRAEDKDRLEAARRALRDARHRGPRLRADDRVKYG